MGDETGKIRVRLFDGTREPYEGTTKTLVRVRTRTAELASTWVTGSSVTLKLPVREAPDNFYSVIAHAEGCRDAGLYPVEPRVGRTIDADLMLLPSDGEFKLPRFSALKNDPLFSLVVNGTSTRPGQRYRQAVDKSPVNVAALLTIGTAIRDFRLADGTSPLSDYHWEVMWDVLCPDRFWAWVDKRLVDRIADLETMHAVAKEGKPGHVHPGIKGRIGPATRSWKQVRFDVSNVQFTFHENDADTRTAPDGSSVDCVVIEPDMDLYRDLGAHGLLEFVPNMLSGKKTNPIDVYQLRWMATRQEGVQPDFEPPVTVE